MKTKFKPGQLRCRKCFTVKVTVPGYCLTSGWPECCGVPMAVDNETERLNHPDTKRRQYAGDLKGTITEWESPGRKMLNTSHGKTLSYLMWCEREASRITAAGTPCVVVWKGEECAVAAVT